MAIIFYLILSFFTLSTWAVDSSAPMGQNEQEVQMMKEKKGSVFVDFISWQQEASIKSSSNQSKLILTNKGTCAGGAYGFVSKEYRTFVDGCILYGSGNVGAEKSSFTYNQTGITAWGAKVSLGMGKFVSPARAEIGFKLPIMYVEQSLDEPSGSNIREPEPFMLMASLYSRWPFEKWFVQSEFSKFLGNDLVLFSVGGGYQF